MVNVAQLGLPSATAGYGVKALVLDEPEHEGGTPTALEVASLDVVAVVGQGGGQGQGEPGTSNAHCMNCYCVGLLTVPAGVTRFVIGIAVQAALRAGQVVFDIWKGEG